MQIRALGLMAGLTLAQPAACLEPVAEANRACPARERLANEARQIINTLRATPKRCGSQTFLRAGPVQWNELLFEAASLHAGDMNRRGYFSHQSPEGRSPGQRIERIGYVWQSYGENIAHNVSDLQATFEAWLRSPPHCQAIMQPEFRDFGLACENAGDDSYWVLELAAPGNPKLRVRGQ